MGISLMVLVMVFNLGTFVIEKGLAHSAVDQGVRAGAREDVDAIDACDERARQVLGNLLTGPLGDGSAVSCDADAEQVTATIHLPLRWWLPGLPDGAVDVSAFARREGVRP